MDILAHRGLWKEKTESNSLESFVQAFQNGFGIETDIRDYCGKLVISHNFAISDQPGLEDLLRIYQEEKTRATLALNIKADGLQGMLKELLDSYRIENYFVFDMSVPEQVVYMKEGFCTYARQSEYEKKISLYKRADGIWMDGFEQDWMTQELISEHLKNGKKIGIVSSEIHGRQEQKLWSLLKKFKDDSRVMLCTDKPLEAKGYFYGKN